MRRRNTRETRDKEGHDETKEERDRKGCDLSRRGAYQKTNMPLPRTSPTAISRPLGPLSAADTMENMSEEPFPIARNVIPATLSLIPRICVTVTRFGQMYVTAVASQRTSTINAKSNISTASQEWFGSTQ
jgi:hypothetical protein